MFRSRLVLAAFMVVSCAACSKEAATPAVTSSASLTTPAPSASVSSDPPRPVGYSKRERAAYKSAVTEYDAFVKRNDEFYAAGETTGAAKKFYHRYAVDWSTAWGDLAQVSNNNVKVTGSTRTVWTRPGSIKIGESRGDVIVLRRCLDESGRVVTQNGKKLEQPQFKKPHVYTIRLEKHRGESWWRSGIAKQGKTC